MSSRPASATGSTESLLSSIELVQAAVAVAIGEISTERGVRRGELARAAGMSPEHLSHMLNDPGNPSWGTLQRIAAGLDMPLSALFERAERVQAKLADSGGLRIEEEQ